MTEAEVVKMLLEHGQQRYESHRYRLPKHVADLVYTNAFAFLVAVAFDRGMSWKKAWEISYWISEEGKLDTDLLAQMSYTALASLLESLPFLPRYGSTEGARTLRDCAKLALEFGGDAASIWRDASPKQVENRLETHPWRGPRHCFNGCTRPQGRPLDVPRPGTRDKREAWCSRNACV